VIEVEADAAVRQALCNGLLRRASVAAAAGVKEDRLLWLRGKADHIASQALAGQQAPLWELVRQLAGRKAARGFRPVAVQRTADGRVIARREELVACWEGLFSAEFSGHTRTFEYKLAWAEVASTIKDGTLVDVGVSEFECICSLQDALGACKLGRVVGPDAVPVEFTRAAGSCYVTLVAQVCQAAAATGVPFTWRGGVMAAVPRKVQKPLGLGNARGVLCSSLGRQAVRPMPAESGCPGTRRRSRGSPVRSRARWRHRFAGNGHPVVLGRCGP
jgi:hypothetical protein